MKTIGVTGPTGAGKTTVLRALEGMGCVCVDCDALYHSLLETSPALSGELTARFGRSILNRQGSIDRKALGAIVFADPAALSDLNAISHRHILARCHALAREAEERGAKGVVFDAIALFESGLAAECDVTLAVIAPVETRVRRIMARDAIGEDYARARVAAQRENEYYVNLCDLSITTDDSTVEKELYAQVVQLFSNILC